MGRVETSRRVREELRGVARRSAKRPRAGRVLALVPVLLLGVLLYDCWQPSVHVEAFAAPHSGAIASRPLLLLALGAVAVACCLVYRGSHKEKDLQGAVVAVAYCVVQVAMNISLKWILSHFVVDEELGLLGLQMAFLLTSLQMFVLFGCFACFSVLARRWDTGYKPERLSLNNRREVAALLCCSAGFALNLGLNNFGFSLVAISVSLVIRACLPLTGTLLHQAIGCLVGEEEGQESREVTAKEWGLMVVGTACAVLAVVGHRWAGEAGSLGVGVAVMLASTLAGSLAPLLKEAVGEELKLSPLDTTCYMSLPAAVMLLLPGLLVPHPVVRWPGYSPMTDWAVLMEVLARRPSAVLLMLGSGLVAFACVLLQYCFVQGLSRRHSTMAGSCNQAVSIVLSLLLGLEQLPPGGGGFFFLLAVAGNVGAFAFLALNMRDARLAREPTE